MQKTLATSQPTQLFQEKSRLWPTGMYSFEKKTYITPGLSGFLDQSQTNSALFSAFWSVELTDFKIVAVENIPPALSL